MNKANRLCIVIPMKNPNQSKQRLNNVLSNEDRKSLALCLFEHTLQFLSEKFPTIDVLVVTPSTDIATLSERYRTHVLIEKSNNGLNHALTEAAQWCIDNDYSSQLTLPADIVRLDEQEIHSLVKTLKVQPSVTISPATDAGTNALLTTPPNIIPFSFGQNSSQKHKQQAELKGISADTIILKNLSFDLDTPNDYKLACQDTDFNKATGYRTLHTSHFDQTVSPFSICHSQKRFKPSAKNYREYAYEH